MAWKHPDPDLPVLIVGAGPAGLVVAQGLLSQSIPFRVFDRLPSSLSSQGQRFRLWSETIAGVQSVLPPWLNAIYERTAPTNPLTKPQVLDAQAFELGPAETLTEPMSRPIDRTWFRQLLTLSIEVEYQKHFLSYNIHADNTITAYFSDGTEARGSVLIGADGIKSLVRKQLQPSRKLLHLHRWALWGRTAVKALSSQVASQFTVPIVAKDMESKMMVITERMEWPESVMQGSGGRLADFEDYIYWVVTKTDTSILDLPKTPSTRRAFLAEAVSKWHPVLREMLDAASYDVARCVPIISSRPDIQLGQGQREPPVIIIGDAAHGMGLMGALGANTSLQTAVDLVNSIKEGGWENTDWTAFHDRMAERASVNIGKSLSQNEEIWFGKPWTEYEDYDNL